MTVRIAEENGAALEDALAELLAVEPHLAYANFRPIAEREGALHRLHRQRWRAAAESEGAIVARDAGGRVLAALSVGRREFESRHFGMSMARVEPPLAVADEARRLPALRAAYAEARDLLRQRGFRHLSGECSAHDRVAAWALQESGAFHVGTRISWMQSLTGVPPAGSDLPSHLRMEHYDRATIRGLEPASWQRLLAWSGEAFDRGPFVFDLAMPRERALQIYQVWTQKALTGEWADVVIVVRDGDEVVAFHTMLLLRDLSEAAGAGIVGRGIGGTLPGYSGLFTALQKECAAARPMGASYLENETQASTVQSIQVFGKLGHRCVRSVATFHMRLDEGGRR